MIYLYETIPAREGDEVKHYEIEQSMSDLPLTKTPKLVIRFAVSFSAGGGLAVQRRLRIKQNQETAAAVLLDAVKELYR